MEKKFNSLYRIHRPSTFDEVVGQQHITKTLANQIKNNSISHAYLFCGTRGTGKTSVAKIFAREINKAPAPSLSQDKTSCLDIFEIDAASNNRVEDVRDLIEKVKYPPVQGRYKVYIVDEVHMFSASAFNAFLKTLEEPPPHVIFILCTTEAHKLPATVQSRCLRFDFRTAAAAEIEKVLADVFKKEKIKAEPEAIKLIAETGAGSFRDALSFADMVVGYCDGEITSAAVGEVLGSAPKKILNDLLTAILNNDIEQIKAVTEKIFSVGRNVNAVIKDFLAVVKKAFFEKKEARLLEIYRTFAELDINIKTAADAQNLFEGAALLCLTLQ